jgi:hypothetical protein
MNNIKKNRTKLKVINSKIQRFTFNKTAKDQPRYENIQPRYPGSKGFKASKMCKGSSTNVGCKICNGYTYFFEINGAVFNGALPKYGSIIAVNPISIINNPLLLNDVPCDWLHTGYVASMEETGDPTFNYRIEISIEDESRVSPSYIRGVYFFQPVGGNVGAYTGQYVNCEGQFIDTSYLFKETPQENEFILTAKRMGAPYRNPLAGWRKTLECCDIDCEEDCTSKAPKQSTHTVYKDIYSGRRGSGPDGCGACNKDCKNNNKPLSGVQGKTHRPIIRSGMQEKKTMVKKDNCAYPENKFSFSYQQYRHNKRCLSYERSLEKYTDVYPCKDENGKCQYKFNKSGCDGCMAKCESNKSNIVTTYKPKKKNYNNYWTGQSASSRMEKLKLQTIKSSNSKCSKNERCQTIPSRFSDGGSYKVPRGTYGGGKPRFTGWMFNKKHKEVVPYPLNFRRLQQPLGIPQLTRHPPGETCIKQCFPRKMNLANNEKSAAGNRARIPGAKCCNNYMNDKK